MNDDNFKRTLLIIVFYLIAVNPRDFGFGKAGMEELISEEVKMFVEEVITDDKYGDYDDDLIRNHNHMAIINDDAIIGHTNLSLHLDWINVNSDIFEQHQQVKKSEGEPFDFISKFNLPVVNALWNVTAGHRFEYNDPKLISMIQVEIRYVDFKDTGIWMFTTESGSGESEQFKEFDNQVTVRARG